MDETNDAASTRIERMKARKKDGQCLRCPPHRKENLGRQARDDRQKNHRRS